MKCKKVSKIFKTLSNPTDVKILLALKGEKQCVTALEMELNLKQSNLSQHLNYLRNKDILDYERSGNRNCYYIKDKRYIKLIEYISKHFKEVCDEE